MIAGDQEAFRELMEKYQTYIFQVVYSVLRHQKDAEDVTQEVFIRIYHALPQYKNQGFKTWMSRVAVNKAIDLKRKKQREKEDLTEIEKVEHISHGNVTEMESIQRERVHLVKTRLNEMPENYRDVMFAYYIQDKTYREIAKDQGIEVKSVESKLYRAKKWIRKNWKEEEFK
ncbi:RNA polymerase sigma factor [Chengkuizengella axinellae]|uniref:Sigma-70 family RNA polymerase sigma factor n=1 Tax=Chengkuizengella axinellae TaxID=3064388 RepID=A0ABT9J2U7_9BACL|nr:sigma-70 family RNA polymerase sigma factor [Chengkuizengella sp. 2205SS18-9]MDP5275340.1 sigma-70 family RNA polymerase sigma factor [Chengkuizengella sp. 2205SS18-9]